MNDYVVTNSDIAKKYPFIIAYECNVGEPLMNLSIDDVVIRNRYVKVVSGTNMPKPVRVYRIVIDENSIETQLGKHVATRIRHSNDSVDELLSAYSECRKTMREMILKIFNRLIPTKIIIDEINSEVKRFRDNFVNIRNQIINVHREMELLDMIDFDEKL